MKGKAHESGGVRLEYEASKGPWPSPFSCSMLQETSYEQKFPDNPHFRADYSTSDFQPDFRIFMGPVLVFSAS